MALADTADAFANMRAVIENGPDAYRALLETHTDSGQCLARSRGLLPPADRSQELFQTLHSLERFGAITPYQRRCATQHADDPSPWMRIGRPTKVELLMLVLMVLARYSGRDDAAVLLSSESQGTILGFDYGNTRYPTGASLLVSFPTALTAGGVLLTLRAPDRFVLLQAESKGLRSVYYFSGELGTVEDSLRARFADRLSVAKLPDRFWHYSSVLGSDEDVPLPFSNLGIHPGLPVVELAGFLALIVRTRANCLKRKVGAVFIDLYPDEGSGQVRGIGYNGFKSVLGRTDSCDVHFCNKRRYGGKDDALCFSPCAEMDAFRGFFHDDTSARRFWRQRIRRRDPGRILQAAVTTIEPCERCASILFENGVFDLVALDEYDADRTQTLKKLVASGHVSMSYLGTRFWKDWNDRTRHRDPKGTLDTGQGGCALDPIRWTSSERWIRCPDRWQTLPRAGVRAGSSMTTSKPRPSGWCSTTGRPSRPWRATWISPRARSASGSSGPRPTARTAGRA